MSNRIKSLFVLILVVCISACESGGESPESGLKGTWSMVSFEASSVSVITTDDTELRTTSDITASDINYLITFGDSDFNTEGGYTITNVVDLLGFEQTLVSILTDINVSGTYTNTATEIIFSEGLFSLDLDGNPQSGMNNTLQAVAYQIDASGDLLFVQDEMVSNTEFGITTSVTIQSTVRFERN